MNLGGDFFTMTFIPDDKVKIAYAPSFGVGKIPDSQKEKTKTYLQRIDYISVRENEGIKIVKELAGRDVPQVVDPTILVDKSVWDKAKGQRLISEEYILCYFISSNSKYRKFAKKLSNKTGLKIVSIPHVDEFVKSDEYFGDIVPEGVGPLQFVNLVSNASYVCTDSFHGSVFSTLYETPFFTFRRCNNNKPDSTNSRLYSFLNLIGMEDRLYNADHELATQDLSNLDFTKAKMNLQKMRNESISYLNNALNNVGR